MDPFKEAAGAVVILFMLLGAIDMLLVGTLLTVSSIMHGNIAGIIFGGILLLIGIALCALIWRAR